jgi:carboxyl-terminal processing protease
MNDRDKDAAKDASKPQAKPATKPAKDKGGKDEAEEEPVERLEYASKKDHQFQQALNLLKGLQIMQTKAQ